MELPDELKCKSDAEIEEWFLAGLSEEKIPVAEMLRILSFLAASGDIERSDGWAELLQDALAERSDGDGGIRLLELRCAWHEKDAAFRRVCKETVSRVFHDRLGLAFANSVGFDRDVALKECMRRLSVLIRFKPGLFCYSRTWGFGIVKRIDDFYQKVTIDFDKKPGHQMSFAYAGETIELISDDHLLARKHRNAAELAELVRNDPAEVVRIALISYGAMSASRLKEVLVDDILQESEWKSFWETARKQLKADPLVDLPSRRSEPIRLIEKEKEYGEEWFALLKRERDPEKILELAGELEQAVDTSDISDNLRQVLGDRLVFALRAVEGRRFHLVAGIVITAKRLGFSGEPIDVAGITEGLLRPDEFLSAAAGMPAREVGKFIKHLAEYDALRTSELLLSLLARMQLNVLNEAVNFLTCEGREQDCVEQFRSVLSSGNTGVEILYWLCRHLDLAHSLAVVKIPELLIHVVDLLEKSCTGERLKIQNQLRKLFEQKQWLSDMLSFLDGEQREELLSRVNNSRGWDAVGRRAVMAKMIKLYPELEKVMVSEQKEMESETGRGRFTSWRSYRERQEQLRKLVEETIPENSREIAVARSYGDLSENAEYREAKERQGILQRRQGEMEMDLKEVRGTDFSGFPTDKAGMGTCIVICRPDGHTERYCILGEWDRDENLGIISNRSRLVEMVDGHKQGDEVLLPATQGEELCRIIEITGFTDDVKNWIA